jgi:PTH1 family peptidyl-tRNA hydrolase
MDKATPTARALIGLGNPDPKYEKTYHNIGRIFADYYRSSLKDRALTNFLNPPRKKFEYCQLENRILIKPRTFMNQSGLAVKQAMVYFKLKSRDIVVIHDDSDMTVGNYKLSFDQRSAGHKGVQSVIDSLKTQKFWRIKIGVRPKNETIRQKAEKFVLKKISKKDELDLIPVFGQIISELNN